MSAAVLERPPVSLTPAISVVISAWTLRRLESVQAAVASVRTQAPAPHEVIVVVDHNAELLDALAGRLGGLAGVRVVASCHATGLSGARNTGIALAAGDVVAFLDDDAEAQPGWLARLGAAYAGDAAVIAAGGRIVPAWTGEARPGHLPPEFDWVVGCTYEGVRADAGPVRNLIGANMSFRREAFVAVGGFAEQLGRAGTTPLGCEETELCLRVQRAFPHGEIRYLPDAQVRHHVPRERATLSYFFSRCLAEGRSKAQVTRLAGAADSLASERRYVARVLPRGVLRGVGGALRGDLAGVQRAGLILGGLAATGLGYLQGLLSAPL